ncbi:MAG: pantoate--beta-alanine ligase, partial [Candidatus Kryptoniota bacterium]
SVIVSIFVNPTQFGPKEDLTRYPRDIPRDLKLLEKEQVDLVWIPTLEIMYPPGYQTWVEVAELTQTLEGKMRPGHFRGVTTIVSKLFNVTKPDRAYFGQKDAQQALVIHRMTQDLNYPIEIIICPTQREADGLAMSSRNVYLNPTERQAATVLSRALFAAHQAYEDGERNAQRLRERMLGILNSEPLANVQYVSCADPQTLREWEGEIQGVALLSLAVFIGNTRLIDNVVLGGTL